MSTLVHRGPALGLAALVLLAGCATPSPGPTTPAEPSTTATTTEVPSEEPSTETATPSEEPTSVGDRTLVYFVTDTRVGFRLVREPHALAGDPVVAALETMIAGPDDPDYATTWNPATQVRSVTQVDGEWVVDLSFDARTANVGSEGAALMVQQLVWTVTEAVGDPAAAVVLTIDGEPAGEMWGAIEVATPETRADPLDVRSTVQIDNLAEGDTVASPLTVAGEAAVFEATLLWRVLDATGATVADGMTMTSEGQTFAPYSFEVTLEPGTWTLVVEESDPSDGEGGPVMTDSRTVTVG